MAAQAPAGRGRIHWHRYHAISIADQKHVGWKIPHAIVDYHRQSTGVGKSDLDVCASSFNKHDVFKVHEWGIVVVHNQASRLSKSQGSISWSDQTDKKRLIRLEIRVSYHIDDDIRVENARRNRENTVRGQIIAARDGEPIGGRVVDRDSV